LINDQFKKTKNIIFEKNKYSIFKFLKIKKELIISEIKINNRLNNLSIKNSSDYEDERDTKGINMHLNNQHSKNKEIRKLDKINNNKGLNQFN
jgi:hypothetical protein